MRWATLSMGPPPGLPCVTLRRLPRQLSGRWSILLIPGADRTTLTGLHALDSPDFLSMKGG